MSSCTQHPNLIGLCHHIFDLLYPLQPPPTPFPFGNHLSVVCVYAFVCKTIDNLYMKFLFLFLEKEMWGWGVCVYSILFNIHSRSICSLYGIHKEQIHT